MILFHITTRTAWDEAKRLGVYRAPSLGTEGFIHLSTDAQWPRTLQRFFAGQTGLVLLAIDAAGLPVRFEPADGERFPHLYGELPVAAVTEAREL